MQSLQDKYKSIIFSWDESRQEDAESTQLVIRIRFTDQSRLEVKEKFIKEIAHLRYSYQWMQADNILIIRWDNAPKHLAVGLHHKHIGKENDIQPSEEMDTHKVLAFIAKIIGIIFLLGVSFALFAQENPKAPEKPKRRLSFSQLFKEIEDCKDTVYRLENAEVYVDEKTDHRFIKELDSVEVANLDSIIIKKELLFSDVYWERKVGIDKNDIIFYKIHFQKKIQFFDLQTNAEFWWFNCRFDKNVVWDNKGNANNLQIFYDQCFIGEGFYVSNYTNPIFIVFNKTLFEIKNNEKQAIGIRFCNHDKNQLMISECKFIQEGKIVILRSNFDEIMFLDNQISMPIVMTYVISRRLYVQKNNLKNLVAKNLVFQKESSFIDFENIKNKLTPRPNFFFEQEKDFENAENYQIQMINYGLLLDLYKFQNNMESYNACYVEMKTLETRKSAYEYRKNPSLKTFLDWQMNEFLHTFSDYGTDYVKSLIYAFYVILLFAGVYFVFPSQEDNLSKNRFLKFFTNAIEYFRTDKQLTDFQQEKRQKELEELNQFRQNLIDSQGKIPRIISFLGKPFYYQNLYFTEFALWLLHRTDLVKGTWAEIPAKRKLFLGTLVTVYFIFYVLNGVFMRALNAFALSLNFFTTLGYGEMTAKGWIKYLAVLEGAVGWFLLTVFSASLVSQLLQ